MKRVDKALRIQRILDELYPHPGAPLRHRDPFTLLVSVLLSAQSTDERVNRITPRLFDQASTPREMSELPEQRIAKIIHSCGLATTKAKNIKKLSRMLVEEHTGAVPDELAALEALPGVGHKTASVVLCQAFGEPAFPVDTHIHRLAARWGLSRGRDVGQTERDLKKLFPRSRWCTIHLQIIFFGREHCRAVAHDLTSCPICSWAATKRRIRQEQRKRRRPTPRSDSSS